MSIGSGVFDPRVYKYRGFPLTRLVALTTVLHYRADCDTLVCYRIYLHPHFYYLLRFAVCVIMAPIVSHMSYYSKVSSLSVDWTRGTPLQRRKKNAKIGLFIFWTCCNADNRWQYVPNSIIRYHSQTEAERLMLLLIRPRLFFFHLGTMGSVRTPSLPEPAWLFSGEVICRRT